MERITPTVGSIDPNVITEATAQRIKEYILWQEGRNCPFSAGVIEGLREGMTYYRAKRVTGAIRWSGDEYLRKYGVRYCEETGGGEPDRK